MTSHTKKSKLKRGDIALVFFPYSNLAQVKKRPALVVQSDTINTGFSNVIVAQITSKMHRAGLPCRVKILLTDALATGTGLQTDSVIITDNLATIDTSLISKIIGKLSDMTLVDDALRKTFDL